MEKLRPRGDRYDAPATAPALAQSHVLLVRHDAAGVRQELYWFVGRIAGLVLIIGVFVTLATMIVLEPTLITPILLLRNDLLRAGEAIPQDQEPQLYSPALDRRDELGDVITAFDRMVQQVSQAIAQRKQAEKALQGMAEIGELATMIVHEVRNPFTVSVYGS